MFLTVSKAPCIGSLKQEQLNYHEFDSQSRHKVVGKIYLHAICGVKQWKYVISES